MSKLESILNKVRLPAFLISAGLVLALGLGCSGNQTRSHRGGLSGGSPGGMSGGLPGGSPGGMSGGLPGGMSRGLIDGNIKGICEKKSLGDKLYSEYDSAPHLPTKATLLRILIREQESGSLGTLEESLLSLLYF